MNKAFLLLGSNEGDRMLWLQQSLEQIDERCGKIILCSKVYETAAWGIEDQPGFLNMAVCIETLQTPLELLDSIRLIENKLGRQRTVKWGQRTLDIDILFYNDEIIELPELQIPHPYIQERKFALVPLNEIAPEWLHPVFKKTIAELLNDCPDNLEVSVYQR